MQNQTLLFKLKERVNKIDSLDYGNLEPSQIAEVINKGQDQWIRRQLEGINQLRAGAEGSIRKVDDLQYILNTIPAIFTDQGLYWDTAIPADYIEWCRISASATIQCSDCCPRRLIIFMGNEADRDIYLGDTNRAPSYAWATTFSTVLNSTFRIYTNDQFELTDTSITYYRQPRRIVFANSTDPYTGLYSTVDIACEFADNIAELIIDEAAAILSGDLDAQYQQNRLQQSVEHNT